MSAGKAPAHLDGSIYAYLGGGLRQHVVVTLNARDVVALCGLHAERIDSVVTRIPVLTERCKRCTAALEREGRR